LNLVYIALSSLGSTWVANTQLSKQYVITLGFLFIEPSRPMGK